MKVGTSYKTHQGGTVTPVLDSNGKQTGLIHKAGNAYSGKIAQSEAKQKPANGKG